MLLLQRLVGQKIMIGDNIIVTVVRSRGYQITIGIEAPRDVPVFREEIAKRRATEKATA